MKIEIDREEDGRWIAEVPDLPGVMVYGQSRQEAISKAEALALRVIADRLDHGESSPPFFVLGGPSSVRFVARIVSYPDRVGRTIPLPFTIVKRSDHACSPRSRSRQG